MKKRSASLLLLSMLIFGAAVPLKSLAAEYPSKPMTLVVGAAPGGPTDIMARLLAKEMGELLRQTIVVDNKPGANSLIATDYVARSESDGYTLLLAYNAHVANPLLMKSAKYDAQKDFSPVGLAVNLPMVLLASPNASFNTPHELVAAIKAKPDAVTYGSSGRGGAPHLAGELMQSRLGSSMIHVPFKGNAPALTELMASRIDFMFYPMIGIKDFVEQKRVKLLGVTAAQRLPDFPGAPTLSESGLPGFEQTSPWIGMLAPANTPADRVAQVSAALKTTLAKASVKERLRQLGAVPSYRDATEFATFLRGDIERWSKVISAAGLQPE